MKSVWKRKQRTQAETIAKAEALRREHYDLRFQHAKPWTTNELTAVLVKWTTVHDDIIIYDERGIWTKAEEQRILDRLRKR